MQQAVECFCRSMPLDILGSRVRCARWRPIYRTCPLRARVSSAPLLFIFALIHILVKPVGRKPASQTARSSKLQPGLRAVV